MATKALPIICVMFLLFTSFLMLPSAEAVRNLEEAQTKTDATSYGPLNPGRTPNTPRGSPYTRPCSKAYSCSPPGA